MLTKVLARYEFRRMPVLAAITGLILAGPAFATVKSALIRVRQAGPPGAAEPEQRHMSDGAPGGVDGAVARVYGEDTSWDEHLATQVLSQDDRLDGNFNWNPCFTCDGTPDLVNGVENPVSGYWSRK